MSSLPHLAVNWRQRSRYKSHHTSTVLLYFVVNDRY